MSTKSDLAHVQLFDSLSDDEKALLVSQMEEVSFASGQMLFRHGDPGDAAFIVSSGAVELFIEDSTGERVVFETANAGDFFGELSLLDGEPRSASALAISETRALRIDRADLETLFSKHPASALRVLRVVAKRLRHADRLLGVRTSAQSPNEAIDDGLTPLQKLSDAAAAFSGTFAFLMLHAVWFSVWIGLNVAAARGIINPSWAFDEYPFGLLTMVVSLEAIFLSCMVLISQDRQAAKERIRSDVEYAANIRAGLEVTQLHVKLDRNQEQIAQRLATLEAALRSK